MKQRQALLVSLPITLAFLGCAASQPPQQPQPAEHGTNHPCHDADIAAKRVWNDEIRVQVRAQVMEWGSEVGVDVAEERAVEVTSSMDRVTDDWARLRKAVCRDHFVRDTLTKAQYQARADCLDRLLTRQRTLLNSLGSPQSNLSEQLAGMTDELQSCR